MKGRIFFLTLLLGLCVAAQAQLGFNIGYSNSLIKTDTRLNFNGINGGVTYDMLISGDWYMLYALNYSYFAKTVTDKPSNVLTIHNKYRYHFVELPIQGAYILTLFDEIKVMGFAGPKLGYALSGTKIVERETIIDEKPTKTNLYDSNRSKFDVKLGVGLGIQYKKYRLKAGYDWGLLNQYSGPETNVNWYRNEFFVNIGIIF